jgi:hypothetical protein
MNVDMTKKWIDLFKRVETKALIGLGLYCLLHPLVDELLFKWISKANILTDAIYTYNIFWGIGFMGVLYFTFDGFLKYDYYKPSYDRVVYAGFSTVLVFLYAFGGLKSKLIENIHEYALLLSAAFVSFFISSTFLYLNQSKRSLLTNFLIVFFTLTYYLWFKIMHHESFNYILLFPSFCFQIASGALVYFYYTDSAKATIQFQSDALPFLQDQALNKAKPKDELGYEQYAKDIVARMNVTRPETAFAIGINGTWGSGKTSFFKLMRDEMPEDKFIIVEFSAWKSADAKTLVKDFFEVLSEELKYHKGGLTGSLMRYADKLVEKADNNVVKLAKEVVDSITGGSQDLNSAYEIINQAIGKLDKKLVIFLDDLDRLDKTEIFEVLRLVRNTADFRNTFFVLAYDREYVEQALRDANIPKSERYLDKIVQMEAMLPYYRKSKLKYMLYEKLTPLFKHDAVALSQLKLMTIDLEVLNIDNIRDIVRFSNGIILNIKNVGKDICVPDFIILEYIRFKYPFEYISLKYNTFLYLKKSIKRNVKQLDCWELRHLGSQDEDNSRDKIIEKILELLIGDRMSSIYTALDYYKRFQVVRNFEHYFGYKLSEDEIPEDGFNSIIKTNDEEFDYFVKKWSEEGKGDSFIRHILRLKNGLNDTDTYKRFLDIIFRVKRYYYSRNTSDGCFDTDKYSNTVPDEIHGLILNTQYFNPIGYGIIGQYIENQENYPWIIEASFLFETIAMKSESFEIDVTVNQLESLSTAILTNYNNIPDNPSQKEFENYHQVFIYSKRYNKEGYFAFLNETANGILSGYFVNSINNNSDFIFSYIFEDHDRERNIWRFTTLYKDIVCNGDVEAWLQANEELKPDNSAVSHLRNKWAQSIENDGLINSNPMPPSGGAIY